MAKVAKPDASAKQTSHALWVAVCLLLGIGLRLYRLDAQSLWSDEGIQFFIASADSLWEVIQRARDHTFHPPLSFVLNYVFLQIQESDAFLRLPSALLGIISLPLTYGLARKLTSKPVALGALFVLAISPLHIWYSQEARMYMPLLLASVLNTLVLLQALERGKFFWWVLYACTMALGVFLHIFMVLNGLLHLVWLLLCHRRALLHLIATGIVAALLAAPVMMQWAEVFTRQLSPSSSTTAATMASGDRIGFELAAIPYTFYTYGAGLSLGPSISGLHANRGLAYLLQFLPSMVAVGLIFGVLLVLGLLALPRQGSWSAWGLCLLGLSVPIAGVAVFTVVGDFSYNVRYTLIAYPYFCILAGAGCVVLAQRYRWAITLAVLALVGLAAVSLTNYFGNPDYAKDDVRAAVALWRSASTDEPLLGCSAAGGVGKVLNRYLNPEEQKRYVWVAGNHTAERAQAVFENQNVQSVYILIARDWQKRRENAIREAFEVVEDYAYPGVSLMKITRKSTDPSETR
ncbi:MAG: glycosyltransferase family 39 protein [Candidatus Tectomicrobia bacterium]|nr:glycosyltransferase family 39 protein [Candidatus Tectomicrobia bacterium]